MGRLRVEPQHRAPRDDAEEKAMTEERDTITHVEQRSPRDGYCLTRIVTRRLPHDQWGDAQMDDDALAAAMRDVLITGGIALPLHVMRRGRIAFSVQAARSVWRDGQVGWVLIEKTRREEAGMSAGDAIEAAKGELNRYEAWVNDDRSVIH